MTILEALMEADQLRPNEIPAAVKLRWLSSLDGQLHRELLSAFCQTPEPFAGYDEQTELKGTELLAPWPYDELYPRYLVMRLDLEHGELERYNNDAALFNRLCQSFAAYYNRSHQHLGAASLQF